MTVPAVFFAVALLTEAAAAPPPVAPDPDDRVVCRVYDVTGSLARKKRICHTTREWRQMSQDAREGAERLQDKGHSAPGTLPGG